MKVIDDRTLARLLGLFEECEAFVFLDTSKPGESNRRSLLFIEPEERLTFHQGDDENRFLDLIQKHQHQGKWVAGWFGYEFGYLFEPGLQQLLCRNGDKGAVLADFGVFSRCREFDHFSGRHSFPLHSQQELMEGTYTVGNLRPSQSRDSYVTAIRKVLDYILAGDTYQINYTLKLLFDFSGSPEQFYRELRRNQSVGYGAYIRWGDKRIMSFSPELFLWRRDGQVTVKPMKGTVHRGKTPEEDKVCQNFLSTDIKNQSENVMIVDLLRNDLGRLMYHLSGGDVRVDSLFDIEKYETLFQMTSTIVGQADGEAMNALSLYSFLKAIFPCGSVTGAPKIRTMEIIDELECDRRGVYTGAIGFFSPNNEAVFNVPIRTVVLDGNRGEMGIGSGIVHDSVPEDEWEECLLKGRFLTDPEKPFSLIETMVWTEDKGIFLESDHLERLWRSAGYFLFSCDRGAIKEQLDILASSFTQPAMRIRLLLNKDGNFTMEASPFSRPQICELPKRPLPQKQDLPAIWFSGERVSKKWLWLYHKTTRRKLYESEFEKAGQLGVMDLLLANEDGFITEGCISNVIVYSQGTYYTPPLRDGLLGGVMRQHLLLSQPEILKEKSLTQEDISRAEALFLCNSVRGLTQVQLTTKNQSHSMGL